MKSMSKTPTTNNNIKQNYR